MTQYKANRGFRRIVHVPCNDSDELQSVSGLTLQLQHEQDAHKLTISRASKVIEMQKAEIRRLKKGTVCHQTEQSHDPDVKTLNEQIAGVKVQLRQEKDAHKATISDAWKVIDKQKAEICDLKKGTVSNQNIKQSQERAVKALNKQTDELKDQLQQEKDAHKGTIDKLKAEINDLQQIIVSDQNVKQSYEAAVKTLNEQIAGLTLQLQQEQADHQSTYSDSCNVINQLRAENKDMQNIIVSDQNVKQSYEAAFQTWNEQIAGLTLQLQQEQAHHQSTISNGWQVIDQLKAEISDLKKDTVSGQNKQSHGTDVKTLKERIVGLTLQLQQQQVAYCAKINMLYDAISDLTDENDQLKKGAVSGQNEQSHDKDVKTLNDQITRLKNQLQKEQADHKLTVKNSCKVIDQLRTEIRDLKK
ncbi:uncharacterized protein V6R79_023095 [Siganus canaliculatus]